MDKLFKTLPKFLIIFLTTVLICTFLYYVKEPISQQNMSTQAKLNYPATRKSEQVDNYHGVEVADPYRWLENPDSEETIAWVKAQNEITFNYLNQIPVRDDIKERLTKLWDYEKYGIPFREGNRYFYFKNNGLQNQSVLYTLKNLDDKPEVLLDPNQLSEDGTVALSGTSISVYGEYLAYGISIAGSDWHVW